jgi:hypothetical protein
MAALLEIIIHEMKYCCKDNPNVLSARHACSRSKIVKAGTQAADHASIAFQGTSFKDQGEKLDVEPPELLEGFWGKGALFSVAR